jgi:hypothetical protein
MADGPDFEMNLHPFGKLYAFLSSWQGREITDAEQTAARYALDHFIEREGGMVLKHIQNKDGAIKGVYIASTYPPEKL